MANQITRWDPFNSALSLRDAMDRLFEESFIWPRTSIVRDTFGGMVGALPMDMYETEDELVVRAQVPGLKSDQVSIQIQDGRLIIEAQMPEQKVENATYHYRELWSGQFHREVNLPFPVSTDKIEAVLDNGLLTLHLPKAEEVKPKKIQIKAH